MKLLGKWILMTILLLSSSLAFSQENYTWDVIVDSLEDTQKQLYSKTKLFIGETWKSAKDVIQSDDPESGVVLVKGLDIQELYYQMNNHRWTYAYSVKFFTKDTKCRIVIDNVHSESARTGGHDWPLMPIAESYPESKGMRITGVNEERYLLLMSNLKADLQAIVDSYESYMRKPLVEDDEW